jgi:hypothetical protein
MVFMVNGGDLMIGEGKGITVLSGYTEEIA